MISVCTILYSILGYSLLKFSSQFIKIQFTVYYNLVHSLLQSYSKCPPLAARHFRALDLTSKIAFWETAGSSQQLFFSPDFNLKFVKGMRLWGVVAYKIRSTSLKLGSQNRKLYVDLKNGFNLENLITNESVGPYSPFF